MMYRAYFICALTVLLRSEAIPNNLLKDENGLAELAFNSKSDVGSADVNVLSIKSKRDTEAESDTKPESPEGKEGEQPNEKTGENEGKTDENEKKTDENDGKTNESEKKTDDNEEKTEDNLIQTEGQQTKRGESHRGNMLLKKWVTLKRIMRKKNMKQRRIRSAVDTNLIDSEEAKPNAGDNKNVEVKKPNQLAPTKTKKSNPKDNYIMRIYASLLNLASNRDRWDYRGIMSLSLPFLIPLLIRCVMKAVCMTYKTKFGKATWAVTMFYTGYQIFKVWNKKYGKKLFHGIN